MLDHLAGNRADGGLAAGLHGWLCRPRERHGIGRRLAERLTFHASSTELTAIETGHRELFPWSRGRAVVPSDSRTALRHLLRPDDDTPPLARSVVSLTQRLRDF